MKKISKVLALVLVLVMSVCMFTGCGSEEDKIEKTVTGFLSAMVDNDADRAASYCDGNDLESQIEYALEENAEDWRELEYEITEFEYYEDEDYAEVEADCYYNGESDYLSFELEKIDGKWMIVDIY